MKQAIAKAIKWVARLTRKERIAIGVVTLIAIIAVIQAFL